MYYRTAGPWGPGTGANLTAAEFDSNTWTVQQQMAAKAEQGVGIANFITSGNELYVVLTDHSMLGPYPLPTAAIQFRGEWTPSTQYFANDIFTQNGTTYIVLQNHTSAGTFDPGANDGSGHNLYGLLLENPSGVLPTGGLTGSVLTKVSTTDFDATWSFQTLAGLGDVQQSPPPTTGDLISWDGSEFSFIPQSGLIPPTPNLADLSDVLASPAPTDGQVVYWSNSAAAFTYKTLTGVTTLAALTDVAVSSMKQGDRLSYDVASTKWKNVQSLTFQTASTATSYTFVLTDANTIMNYNGSAAGIWVMVSDSSAAFAHGTLIAIRQQGNFKLFVDVGVSASITWPAGRIVQTRGVGSVIFIQHTGSSSQWIAYGDLDYDPTYTVITDGAAINIAATDDIQTWTWTPASNNTITVTNAQFGYRMTIVITTSGTSSFTLTFGTGFKSTGTLATGTVTAKKFTISFVGDGTTMNEVSRTTAM